jgi:quinohemoprotein ethanol dehydrogenase
MSNPGTGQSHRRVFAITSACASACLALTASVASGAQSSSPVDDAMIIANAAAGTQWPSNGLDYAATRFSRLHQINDASVSRLGLDELKAYIQSVPDSMRAK